MRQIRLKTAFFDGQALHKAGAVIDFLAEGDLPPGAQLLSEEPAPSADPLAKVGKK